MLSVTQTAGLVGAVLAGAAYAPQIWHLVHARCAAGISRPAFGVWLVSSVLVTVHAVATAAMVFVLLGVVQIVALSTILVCATRYRGTSCAGHEVPRSESTAAPDETFPTTMTGGRR